MCKFQVDAIQKILIRSVNWIGDAVMTTPAIAAIREYFPHAEISMLANGLVSQLFAHHRGIDKIITFDRNGLHGGIFGRLRLAAELRKYNFDLVIILPNSFDSALVPWLAGIPSRMGVCLDGRTLLLNKRCNIVKGVSGEHEVAYYLNLVKCFDISGSCIDPFLCVAPQEEEDVATLLQAHGVRADDFVLGINPGASYGSAKRWYPDRFAQVARRLASEWSAKIVVFGGPGEIEIAVDIENSLEGSVLNLAGKTSVRELMALIKRCNFFISNDSGPMHIAAAFDVPLVAIFGSTDHRGTAPYSKNSVVVRKSVECAPCKLRECPKDHSCMTSITAEDVVSAARKLYLEEQKGNRP